MAKRLNVVFDDESLYRALKVEAARRGVPAKQIVAAALEMWLEVQEDADDLAVSREALADYETAGGTPARQVHTSVEGILAAREGQG